MGNWEITKSQFLLIKSIIYTNKEVIPNAKNTKSVLLEREKRTEIIKMKKINRNKFDG